MHTSLANFMCTGIPEWALRTPPGEPFTPEIMSKIDMLFIQPNQLKMTLKKIHYSVLQQLQWRLVSMSMLFHEVMLFVKESAAP